MKAKFILSRQLMMMPVLDSCLRSIDESETVWLFGVCDFSYFT